MKDHYDGYEKERLFHKVLGLALQECPNLKAMTLKKIIEALLPGFCEGLFQIRPCIRRLRYVGLEGVDELPRDCSRKNDIYSSVDFNGATYGFADYERRVGLAHFEWIDE